MNIEKELKMLEETKQGIISFSTELDSKLEKNEINQIEYSVMMHDKLCGKDKNEVLGYIDSQIAGLKRKAAQEEHAKHSNKKLLAVSAAAIVLIVMAIIGIIVNNPGASTGYVIKPIQETTIFDRTFDHYTETQLELTGITGFRISGTLTGERAIVKLRAESIEYLVANITNIAQQQELTRTYSLKTDKTIYTLGESAQIIITPEGTAASMYVTHNNNTDIIEGTAYTPAETGEYGVVAVISDPVDIVRLETGFSVIDNITNETVQGDNTVSQVITETTNETNEAYIFEAVCAESCNIAEINNPLLVVEPAEGAVLTISNISLAQNKENQAPSQTKTMPDIIILTGQEAKINLDDYFTDPDDSTIYYDVSAPAEVQTNIAQDELTLSSELSGTYSVYIYASDESELVASNIFLITITDVMTNETLPTEQPTAENTTGNESENITEPITEPITPSIDECSNPDPNKRPLICTQGFNSTYFKPEEIVINNKQGMPVARFTPIGNLLIKGEVIEQSTEMPSQGDYQLGYLDDNGDYAPTIWIDSTTGSLHLKGNLIEANGNIPISEGLSALANQRGIILALFNRQTGDMIVRGNVIPYRRDVTQ